MPFANCMFEVSNGGGKYERKRILDKFISQVKFNNLYIHEFSTSLYTNNFWYDETLKGKRGFGNGQWSLIGRELFLKEIKNCFCFDYFQVDGFKMSLSQPVESCWPLWDMIPASV